MFYSQVNFQRPVEDHTVSMEDPEKNLLQLGQGGWMFLRSPLCILLKLALFSSPPRKLSLLPSDRASGCDSG